MKNMGIFWSIKIILFALLLLSIQLALTRYVHPYFAFPDILMLFFLLILFNAREETIHLLFIVAFCLGIIQAVWFASPFRLGTTAFFYMLITYNYKIFGNIMQNGIQMFVTLLFFFFCKFLLYNILGLVFGMQVIFSFLYGHEFLYQIFSTMILLILVGFPINLFARRRKEYAK